MTRERWLNGGLLLAVLAAFYSGFRMPSLWSINYYIPGVFDGFWRRAVIGTLLTPVDDLRFNYYFIASLQALVLGTLLAVVVGYAWKASWRAKTILVLFFVGPAGGYLFHEIGYVDQVLYLMLFGALAMAGTPAAAALLVASLFVHEMAAFTIVPLYLAWVFAVQQRYRVAIVHGALFVVAFGIIYTFFQTAASGDIERLMQRIAAYGQYKLRPDYYDVFKHALNGPRPQNWFSVASAFELVCTCAVALLAASPFYSRQGAFKAAGVIAAALAPLLLGFIGWDSNRWIFLALSSGTILTVLLADRIPVRLFGAVLTVYAAFGIVGFLVYFDDYQPRRLTPWPRVGHFVQTDFPSQIGKIPSQ